MGKIEHCQREKQKFSNESTPAVADDHLALLRRCYERESRAHAALRRADELMQRTRTLIERSQKSFSF
jgi:hypothetical protein